LHLLDVKILQAISSTVDSHLALHLLQKGYTAVVGATMYANVYMVLHHVVRMRRATANSLRGRFCKLFRAWQV